MIVCFYLNLKYFDLLNFLVSCLCYLFKVKVVFCLKFMINFKDYINKIEEIWYYEDGFLDYLNEVLDGYECLLNLLFIGDVVDEIEVVSWVLIWLLEGELLVESYVNLILIF